MTLKKGNFLQQYKACINDPLGQGVEGTVYSCYNGIFKIFHETIPENILNNKLEILEYMNTIKLNENHPSIMIAEELFFEGDKFRGYLMGEAPNTSFADAVKGKSIDEILELAKNLENLIRVLHSYDIYPTDLTELNIKVYKSTIYLIDVDSFCKGETIRTKDVPVAYRCPYSKKVSKQSNLFTVRLLTIIALTGEKFYDCDSSFFNIIILKNKLKKLAIDKDIKKQLLKIFTKKGFESLDYMF